MPTAASTSTLPKVPPLPKCPLCSLEATGMLCISRQGCQPNQAFVWPSQGTSWPTCVFLPSLCPPLTLLWPQSMLTPVNKDFLLKSIWPAEATSQGGRESF